MVDYTPLELKGPQSSPFLWRSFAQGHPRVQQIQDPGLGFCPFPSTRHFPLSDSARGFQHLQSR